MPTTCQVQFLSFHLMNAVLQTSSQHTVYHHASLPLFMWFFLLGWVPLSILHVASTHVVFKADMLLGYLPDLPGQSGSSLFCVPVYASTHL